jgi:hypothetical protein
MWSGNYLQFKIVGLAEVPGFGDPRGAPARRSVGAFPLKPWFEASSPGLEPLDRSGAPITAASYIRPATAVRALARGFAHHRIQRVDNKRNSARLPRYLAAGRVFSNPPIIVAPWRSQTRHSHLVELRSVTNTSNTTAPRHRQLRTVKLPTDVKGVGSLLDSQM